ncbi:hypothetical protein OG401_32380 [Kitasatospora purpeofusca]|uniref:hypothetical protein n=1 Tax=Kitasatospora purpeofusca TaxID=67352 RepID=UPI0022536D76|nr:hypothetical protein [Kitasatospora purpeofusca]MCX4688940.1 hypothetical protein [Kitasatospora purpeofusca]
MLRSIFTAGRGMHAMVIANAAGAAVSMAFSAAGLLSPALALSGGADPVTPLADLYAQLYAARALPLGAVLLHQLLIGRTGRALAPLLLVSGVVQVADAAIGASSHNPGMVVGGTVLAALHLGLAARLARSAHGVGPTGIPAPEAV